MRDFHTKMPILGSTDVRKSTSESSVSWCIFSTILLVVTGAFTFVFAATRLGAIDGSNRDNRGVDLAAEVRPPPPVAAIVRQEQVVQSAAPGFFFDIGASANQVRASYRTRHLEKKGFAGICAVPFPGNFAERSCRVVALPVSGASGEKVKVQDCSNSPPESLQHLIAPFAPQFSNCPLVEANTMGIVDLLALGKAPRVIDFIQLDTNGTELAILNNFPVDSFCVRAWTVKHNYNNDDLAKIRHILEIGMGCHVREGAGEYWARCPCDKKVPAAATTHPEVHAEVNAMLGHAPDAAVVLTSDGHPQAA